MANNFHRVSRSLQRDNTSGTTLHLLTGILLLMAWLVWAFRAQVACYEVSDSAQIEVDPASPRKLQVNAEFQPLAALGKLRPGQPAILRLAGLPATQCGTVSAQVSGVAKENHRGKVTMELAINSTPPPVLLQHGSPGSIQIEVERISPAALILRSAGELAAAN
jgi:hypothetical protein